MSPSVEPDTSQRTACPGGTERGRERGSGSAAAAGLAGSVEEQTSGSLQEPV